MTVPTSSNAQTHNQHNSSPQLAAATQPKDGMQIAIIGAGLTGLITADLIERQFAKLSKPIQITLFEKSAGVGRLATRYKTPTSHSQAAKSTDGAKPKQWQFDFGAAFFTAKTVDFQEYMKPWLADNTLQPWQAKLGAIDTATGQPHPTGQWDLVQPRYVSCPKMTSWGRSIAKRLQHSKIIYKTRVAPLTQSDAPLPVMNITPPITQTQLSDSAGNDLGVFDWVICTAPQAQALELMAHSGFGPLSDIQQPSMLACYVLMLGWGDQQTLPDTLKQADWSVLQIEDKSSCLDRLIIEHHKPDRQGNKIKGVHDILPSITVYANNDWSQTHVDDDIEDIKTTLLKATQSLFDWDSASSGNSVNSQSAPIHIDCHRWRYAATQPSENAKRESVFCDSPRRLIVTGDWCDDGRIESCFKVASKTAHIIKNTINSNISKTL